MAATVALVAMVGALSLAMALAVTFPFNLAVGIPLFHEIAQRIG